MFAILNNLSAHVYHDWLLIDYVRSQNQKGLRIRVQSSNSCKKLFVNIVCNYIMVGIKIKIFFSFVKCEAQVQL